MVGRDLSDVVRQLRRIVRPPGEVARSDAQLLESFSERRDEAAFELLLARHGPMVLGVCKRLLYSAQDVEDAFQATFLVLVRKASSLRERALLANWLYGVAYRIAFRVRTNNARRRATERLDADCVAGAAEARPAELEIRWLLHEELQRLPDKYRRPVVLCYLEEQTHEEAARLLRWPLGTVKGRLARARELLRRRLTRRGVTLSSAALAAALSSNPVTALPPPLIVSTVKAALGLAAGEAAALGGVSASVIGLVNASVRTMSLAKVKSMFMLMTILAAVVPGAGIAIRQLHAPGAGEMDAIFPLVQASADPPAHSVKPLADTVDLRVKWSEGQPFYQEDKTESALVMKVMGQDVVQKSTGTLWTRCTPLGEQDGNRVLMLEFVSIKLHSRTADRTWDFDSTAKNQPADPWGNLFTSLLGDQFKVHFGGNGTASKYLQPVKVEGCDVLLQRLRFLQQGGFLDASTAATLKSLLSEDAFKHLVFHLTGPLPGGSVHKGDTWFTEYRQEIPSIGQYLTAYRYTYEGLTDTQDRIAVRTKFTYAPPRPGDHAGMFFKILKADLKNCDGTGVVLFDRVRGRISKVALEAPLEGRFTIETIGGTSTEVDVRGTQKTTVKTSDINPIK